MSGHVVPHLTPRLRRTLTAFRDYYTTHGHPPPLGELARLAGLDCAGTAAVDLAALCARGWIRPVPNHPNCLEALNPDDGSDT